MGDDELERTTRKMTNARAAGIDEMRIDMLPVSEVEKIIVEVLHGRGDGP